ncbi:YgdI/YgdR family lipoprotein [Serratia sp. S1B]|nr:YgdI/YgdR family lipoprotein [Serratia sp. S1B]
MKKWVIALSILMLIGELTGCSSNYVMETQEGDMLLTLGKPEVNKNTGLITYVDEQGKHRQINGNQVTEVIER